MAFVTDKKRAPAFKPKHVYFQDAYNDHLVWRLELFDGKVPAVIHDDDLRVSCALCADTRIPHWHWESADCPVGISQYTRLNDTEVAVLLNRAAIVKFRPAPDPDEIPIFDAAHQKQGREMPAATQARRQTEPVVQPVSTPANTTDPATEAFYQDRLRAAREGVVLPTEIKMGWRRIDEDRVKCKRESDLREMARLEDGTAICRKDTYSRERYHDLIGFTERKGIRK
jgi:hypothetical protein